MAPTDHSVRPADHRTPKWSKNAPEAIKSRIAIRRAKGAPNPKIEALSGTTGTKPPLKTFKKNSNQGKKGQTSSWPIHNEVYDHILIGHQNLSKRALCNSFWDTTQGPCLKRKEMTESQKKHILKLKELTQVNRRGKIIQIKYDSEEMKGDFQDNGQEENITKKKIFDKQWGDIEMPLNSGRVLWCSGAHQFQEGDTVTTTNQG
ncbi:hypothetical protein O181_129958 [Austropuccinia psidii MF-1]|uniref:Uncharacterized protein n=1 Tax=Austropuccinia psidii MF-1 TaxID=1389203 RepID=A0A9Q3KZ47_9BASI|nr:hypothetical protein [Austropuccinia psidii MF-1]